MGDFPSTAKADVTLTACNASQRSLQSPWTLSSCFMFVFSFEVSVINVTAARGQPSMHTRHWSHQSGSDSNVWTVTEFLLSMIDVFGGQVRFFKLRYHNNVNETWPFSVYHFVMLMYSMSTQDSNMKSISGSMILVNIVIGSLLWAQKLFTCVMLTPFCMFGSVWYADNLFSSHLVIWNQNGGFKDSIIVHAYKLESTSLNKN